ncbi:AsmA family protein [Azospirillum griseum]|uniref:AsmA family protein n=1 Tax=Azospirillum griseum TaxID=2496639 RepID=A0A3S0IEI2_9PROT|nr:AsmA family protein [Azospirillum griseum]RTR19220.1 AsmA family protein [Azospirillum griseum]
MKKILIAALTGVTALVGGVLTAPSLIDWNAYKGMIAERVAAATGRAVDLRGDVGLTLLPAPALTVRDARLANPPGSAEPDMARLKKLDVRVALGPLLSGRIQVESVSLIEPTFVVEVLKDGRLNWDLSGSAAPSPSDRSAADGLVGAISFDQVTIDHGTIQYRDSRTGRSETLDSVNARVVAGSLTGPFQVQGDFRFRGVPLHGELTAGRFTDGAAVPVRAALSMPGTDATLRFAGIVSGGSGNVGGGGALRAQGDLRAEGGDLGKVIGGAAAAVRGQPFNLRASVEAGTSLATFSNLEAQVGDTRATGMATLRPGDPTRTELTLVVNRLDLDAWLSRAGALPPLSALTAPSLTVPAGGARGSASTTVPAPEPWALPVGLEGKLDLSVDGLTYNGAVVRQGRLEASLTNGRLNLDRVSAQLPGGSDVVAAGEVTTPGGAPTLDLRMEANADNLRALLDWLKLDVRGVPPDRLRRASLSVRVQGHAHRFELSGLDLRVDGSRLSGAVAYVDRGRPAFGARLELDRLNLDAYLPPVAPGAPATPTRALPPTVATTTPSATAGAGRIGLPPLSWLTLADANLDLTIGQITVRGIPAQGVHLDATLAGGGLTVREAKVADLVGLTGRVDGQVTALSPLRGVNLALTAEAASLSGVPRAMPWPHNVPPPERLGSVSVKARVAGDAARLALELTAGAAGGRLEAGGALTTLDSRPGADLKLRASHPELGRLAALFTDRGQARAVGPLDLYAEIGGSLTAPTVGNLQGIVAGVPLRGRIGGDLSGPRPRFEADVQTGDLDLDRLVAAPLVGETPARDAAASAAPSAPDLAGETAWLRMADGALALTATAVTAGGLRVEQPALRATLADGTLTLEQLDGEWLGGQIGLSGRVVAAPGRPPAVEADVTVVKADLARLTTALTAGTDGPSPGGLALSGGAVDVDMAVTATGDDRAALLRSLSGRGRVAVVGSTLRGVDLAALRDRLGSVTRPQEVLGAVIGAGGGGETRIDRADGRFTLDHGTLRTDDTRLSAAAGEGVLSGLWVLPEDRLDLGLSLRVKADPAVPPLTLRVAGPRAAPTQSMDMRAVQEHFAAIAAAAAAAAPPASPSASAPAVDAKPEAGGPVKP